MAKKFISIMRDPSTHEFVAFGWTLGNQEVYTVRQAILTAKMSPELQAECPAVFGASFEQVVAALEQYADLDKQYRPEHVL